MTDWAAIERDFRANRPVKAIALEHGITRAAVYKQASNLGWKRDIAEKIREKAAEKVARHEAAQRKIAADEEGLVEAAAQAAAEVELEHRLNLRQARTVAMRLLAELEIANDHMGELVKIVQRARIPVDEDGKPVLSVADLIAISRFSKLSSRAGVLEKISKALATIIDAERKSHGLGDDDKDKGGAAFTLIQNFG